MFRIYFKIIWRTKNQGNITQCDDKRQSMETNPLVLEQTIAIMHNDVEDNVIVINRKLV